MIRRVLFYVALAWRDLIRFRSATTLQALIVAGVCFPILILLALKRGHVADLRQELITSPTGRLVKLYPAGGGVPFSLKELDPLAKSLGNVELAIPRVRRIVSLSLTGGEIERRSENVDLNASCPGDPLLKAQNADVFRGEYNEIVLNETVAKDLKAAAGDTVRLTIARSSSPETEMVDLVLKAVIPAASESRVGYADAVVIDRLTRFHRGGDVKEWDWPPLGKPPAERYPGFLLVNDVSDPLKPADLDYLKQQGFDVKRAVTADQNSLGGAIRPECLDRVIVYTLARLPRKEQDTRRISVDPAALSKATLATDLVIPWYEPKQESVDGKPVRLVGLTFPVPCKWLRKLLVSADLPFDSETDYQQCCAVVDGQGGILQEKRLAIGDGAALLLQGNSISTAAGATKESVAERPADANEPQNAAAAAPETVTATPGGGPMPPDKTSPEQATPPDTTKAPANSAKTAPAADEASEESAAEKSSVDQETSSDSVKADGADKAPEEPDTDKSSADEPMPPDTANKTAEGAEKTPAAEKAAEEPAADKSSRDEAMPPVTAKAPADGDKKAPAPDARASAGASARWPSSDALANTLFVPARLLSYLDDVRQGRAVLDNQNNVVEVVADPTYEDALLFARTIDDVPEIVANAMKRGFPFNAENARIEEIQKQDASLERLVLIVGALVFGFGVLTVFGLLWESTARKRSTIGIIRVMGTSPQGAFLVVFLRALLLGALAGGVTVAAGYLCVLGLTWSPRENGYLALKPVISAVIHPYDLYLVTAASIFCCVVGSIIPAFSAARLDPFDALVQGRYR